VKALQVKNFIDNSVQMSYLRELDRVGMLQLHNFRAPNFFATHMSTKSNLNVDTKVVYTEWANSVDWNKLNADVMDFIEMYMSEAVIAEMKHYSVSKLPYHLSPFDPKVVLNNLLKYGINKGEWTLEDKRLFTNAYLEYAKDIQWTSLHINSLEEYYYDESISDEENWKILIDICPLVKILRHSATSAYPDYKPQTVGYLVKNIKNAYNNASPNQTLYSRRHGYSLDLETGELTEKDRVVIGVDLGDKLDGTEGTQSFKDSLPSWTPYYRPWVDYFDDLLERFARAVFMFTDDQSGMDMHHNTFLTRDTTKVAREHAHGMDDEQQKRDESVVENTYNNPRLIANARYFVYLGRWISSSGSPPTARNESLNNLALHDILIPDKVDTGVQIDDEWVETDREIDLDEFAKQALKRFGFVINPDKTETSKKGHITYLQNMLGWIFNKLKYKDIITISGRVIEDALAYLGHIFRRVHRLRYKERIRQVIGDVIFEVEDKETRNFIDVTETPVARFLGSLGSFGPFLPVELFNIIWKHHKNAYYYWKEDKDSKPVKHYLLAEVIDFCHSNYRVKVGEYGFDPQMVMKYILDNERTLI
jgi:hypothetical protein